MTQTFQDALKNSLLSETLKQAQKHLIIDQLFKSQIDETLKSHCQVAQLAGDTLIIHVDSSIWLTKLTYCASQVIDALKIYPSLNHLKKIQCKVRPFDALNPTEFERQRV